MQDAPDSDAILLPLRALVGEGLAELGFRASEEQAEKLARLSVLVASWAPRINLTGHRSLEAIARRLVLDAAALVSVLPGPPRSLVDIGSGAGFPGLPAAILWEGCPVVLVEARQRKHHFQRAAVRELGLPNVTCERGRAEEIVPHPAALVLAQAVGPVNQVLEWALPWLAEEGLLAIPGSEEPPALDPDPRIADATVLQYRVPLGGPRRTVWIGRLGGHGNSEPTRVS